MMYYLYNKKLGRKLIHPKVGIWYTLDIKEAEEMLVSCREYLISVGLENIIDDFVIKNE